jgi:hypothetical protein
MCTQRPTLRMTSASLRATASAVASLSHTMNVVGPLPEKLPPSAPRFDRGLLCLHKPAHQTTPRRLGIVVGHRTANHREVARREASNKRRHGGQLLHEHLARHGVWQCRARDRRTNGNVRMRQRDEHRCVDPAPARSRWDPCCGCTPCHPRVMAPGCRGGVRRRSIRRRVRRRATRWCRAGQRPVLQEAHSLRQQRRLQTQHFRPALPTAAIPCGPTRTRRNPAHLRAARPRAPR